MSVEQFVNEAVSPWMKEEGEDSDIVLSSRIRFARNLAQVPFPTSQNEEDLLRVLQYAEQEFNNQSFKSFKQFELIKMKDLKPVEKRSEERRVGKECRYR